MAFLIFATASIAACWTIWATVAPEARRIVDLLAFGPAMPATSLVLVSARSSLRNVSARPVVAQMPARMRAAA